jgi:hypothetical protein
MSMPKKIPCRRMEKNNPGHIFSLPAHLMAPPHVSFTSQRICVGLKILIGPSFFIFFS